MCLFFCSNQSWENLDFKPGADKNWATLLDPPLLNPLLRPPFGPLSGPLLGPFWPPSGPPSGPFNFFGENKKRINKLKLYTIRVLPTYVMMYMSSAVMWTESGANHEVNEHHQTKSLLSKTKAVQVCSVNLCTFLSRLLQYNNAK